MYTQNLYKKHIYIKRIYKTIPINACIIFSLLKGEGEVTIKCEKINLPFSS